MPFKTLTYDAYHLGLYMVAALAWTTLCVMVLSNARRRMPGVSNLSCLCTAALGTVICLGFLLADVLRLVDERVVLFGMLVAGVIVPGLTAGTLYMRLHLRRGNAF